MNKPKFDPSKPFSVVDDKPKFDPSKPFKAVDEPSEPGAAALQGFGQSASLGYLPQIQAMTQPLTDRALNLITGNNVEPAPLKQMLPGSTEYLKARDINILRDKQLQQQNPGASAVGELGGAVASSMIPVGALAKGGGLMKAAASGALLGAAQNPGDTQGGFDPLQGKERLAGGVVGAGLGAAGETIGNAIGGLKNLPKKLGDFSDELAFRSLGAFKGDVKRSLKKDSISDAGKTLRELGKFAKEKGLVRGGDKIFDVAERAGALQEETGKKIGQIYHEVNEKVSDPKFFTKIPEASKRLEFIKSDLNPKKMADEFMEEATAKWTGKRGGDQAINRVKQEVENFAKHTGPADIEHVKDFRVSLDKAINFEKDDAIQGALKDFRNFLKKKMDNRIDVLDKIEGSSKTKELKEANQIFSKVVEANKIVQNRLGSEMGNNLFSLTDKMFAGAGLLGGLASGGDPESMAKRGALGLGLGLLSKGARRYGAPALMRGTDILSRASAPLGGLLEKGAANAPGIISDPRFRGALGQRLGRKL